MGIRELVILLVVAAVLDACTKTVERTRFVTVTASPSVPMPSREELEACAKAADVADLVRGFIAQPDVQEAIRLVRKSDFEDAAAFNVALELFTTVREVESELNLSRTEIKTCMEALRDAGISF
jgi:K+ transporter